jgi:hypothetical protein
MFYPLYLPSLVLKVFKLKSLRSIWKIINYLVTLLVENANGQNLDISQLVTGFADVFAWKVDCNWSVLYVMSHIKLLTLRVIKLTFTYASTYKTATRYLRQLSHTAPPSISEAPESDGPGEHGAQDVCHSWRCWTSRIPHTLFERSAGAGCHWSVIRAPPCIKKLNLISLRLCRLLSTRIIALHINRSTTWERTRNKEQKHHTKSHTLTTTPQAITQEKNFGCSRDLARW